MAHHGSERYVYLASTTPRHQLRLTPLTYLRRPSPTAEPKRKTGPQAAPTEPLNTLEQAFSPYTTDRPMLEKLATYFESITVPEGYVVWKQGEPADGLYIVGS